MCHDTAHKFAHVVKVHQHTAIFIAVFGSSLIVIRVASTAVMLTEMQQKAQQNAWHNGFRDAHQVWRHGSFIGAIVHAMVTAEALSFHN